MIETIFILDKSGSMSSRVDATITGFNELLQGLGDDDRVTLDLFNDTSETVIENAPAADLDPLTPETYVCGGMTALLDGVGIVVDRVGKRLAEAPENERPDKVVVVIMTDGHENRSQEYTRERVKEMILHQREKYNWEFTFIGASEEAVEQGVSMGLRAGASMQYNPDKGTEAVFKSVSRSIAVCAQGGPEAKIQYSDADRVSALSGD